MENKEYVWYFAYGSNNSEQLKNRLKTINDFERKSVKLKNWIRIFHSYSKKRNGSIASIKYKKGYSVRGILFKLKLEQLIDLFQFEIGYRLKKFNGSDFDTNIKNVYTFIREDDEHKQYEPNIKYLIEIGKLLKERRQLLESNDYTDIIIDYNDINGVCIKQYKINYKSI